MTITIGKTALATAETKLAGCQNCNWDCNTCPEINDVLDSLMVIRAYTTEIDAAEDKYDADIDRLAG